MKHKTIQQLRGMGEQIQGGNEMSKELKPYIGPHPTDNTLTEYYLKSEADKVIAHHKYKRCLAMALVWFERAENSTDWENELVSRKRFSKWMKLAEKFKEAK